MLKKRTANFAFMKFIQNPLLPLEIKGVLFLMNSYNRRFEFARKNCDTEEKLCFRMTQMAQKYLEQKSDKMN
jgi:hypothetical protein